MKYNTDFFQVVRLDDRASYYSSINNIDINMVDDDNQNLLQEAIAHGNSFIGQDLIKREININHQDKSGLTPLHYVAAHYNPELAEAILTEGGDVNIRDSHGNNALWTAVFNAKGRYDIVKMFISNGGDAYTKNNHHRSPLDFARQIKDEQLIDILS